MKNNRRQLGLRARVRVRFILFYFELALTDPWCNMLRGFTRTEKIWEGNVRWTPSLKRGRYNNDIKTATQRFFCCQKIQLEFLRKSCLRAWENAVSRKAASQWLEFSLQLFVFHGFKRENEDKKTCKKRGKKEI